MPLRTLAHFARPSLNLGFKKEMPHGLINSVRVGASQSDHARLPTISKTLQRVVHGYVGLGGDKYPCFGVCAEGLLHELGNEACLPRSWGPLNDVDIG